MLGSLVAFDTTSAYSNLSLIEFVGEYLSKLGIEYHLTQNAEQNKANLFATIPSTSAAGNGKGEREGGIVLSGHTDVVPVAGQPWETDPFKMTAKDDRLYGRGTSDMKGFLACILALAPEFQKRRLSRPIHFALSYDEEVGCLGVRDLITQMQELGVAPYAAIIGEPTGMKVANSHKGVCAYRTTVTGKDGHASDPTKGANAIVAAAELIGYIAKVAKELKDTSNIDGSASGFTPAFPTINTGAISGVTALNIIARTCTFEWEFRPLPGQDPQLVLKRFEKYISEALLPRLRAVAEDGDVTTELLCEVPPLSATDDNVAQTLALGLTGENDTTVVSFGTEGGRFQEAGVSTIVCGPGHVAQAHQPNEFIDISQLKKCETFLRRLMDWAA
ncbi:MAG: acetylornithine deacetylase, partial [Pseudomonadota bacterium]